MAIEGESLDRPSVVSSIKNQLGLNQPLEPLHNPKAKQVTALLLTVREHLNKPLSKAELIQEWYNTSTIEVPVRAAIAHLWFEIIHPFEDGNGRVGRAIAEHALAQELGRPSLASLSAAIQAKKADYYQALENVNQNIDITSWIIRCKGTFYQ